MPMSEARQNILNKYYKCVDPGKRSFYYYIKKEYLLINDKPASKDQRMGVVDIHNNVINEFKTQNLGTVSLNTMTKWIPTIQHPIDSHNNDDSKLPKIDEFSILVSNVNNNENQENEILKLSVSGLTRKERSDKGKHRIKKIDEFKQL